jgi:hypothetical protein
MPNENIYTLLREALDSDPLVVGVLVVGLIIITYIINRFFAKTVVELVKIIMNSPDENVVFVAKVVSFIVTTYGLYRVNNTISIVAFTLIAIGIIYVIKVQGREKLQSTPEYVVSRSAYSSGQNAPQVN